MRTLEGKKLLVLGSSPLLAGIVKEAQKLGVFVIVTDYNKYENAPAKHIANKYYDISLSDIDLIVKCIKEEKIDGVLTGYTDSYLKYYYEICQKAGLPCYGDLKQFDIATDKVLFKKMCMDAGVPVIPGTTVLNLDDAKKTALKIGYPLMFKPADNSGSRGVIKCNDENQLENCFNYALSFSPSSQVICEKYLDCENIGSAYQLDNGEIFLNSVSDRHVYKSEESGSSVTKDLVYPSIYTKRYIEEVNEKVINMLKANGFKHGMLSFQAFVDDNSFYFCEMCYRPSGGHHYMIVNDQNGVNSLDLLIEFAVNGKIDYSGVNENPYFKETCAMIKLMGESGKVISKIDLSPLNSGKGLISYQSHKIVGNEIGKDGTTAQCLAAIWIKASDRDSLKKNIDETISKVVISDDKGNNLIKNIKYLV